MSRFRGMMPTSNRPPIACFLSKEYKVLCLFRIPRLVIPLAAALTVATFGVCAQAPSGNPVPVAVENFPRAEFDRYDVAISKDAGGVGTLIHRREPATIENRTVICPNSDTLHTYGVFVLSAGPVTITMPDAGKHPRTRLL